MGSTFFEFEEPDSTQSDKKEPVNIHVPKFPSFSAMQAEVQVGGLDSGKESVVMMQSQKSEIFDERPDSNQPSEKLVSVI